MNPGHPAHLISEKHTKMNLHIIPQHSNTFGTWHLKGNRLEPNDLSLLPSVYCPVTGQEMLAHLWCQVLLALHFLFDTTSLSQSSVWHLRSKQMSPNKWLWVQRPGLQPSHPADSLQNSASRQIQFKTLSSWFSSEYSVFLERLCASCCLDNSTCLGLIWYWFKMGGGDP